MAKEKLTQSEIDGVQYRRAKLWQIILIAFNAFNGMSVYILFNNYVGYAANLGFGIATLAVGGLLTFTRIFDAVTDPLLAFLYDRVNTRWGKVRPLLAIGWLIQSIGLLLVFWLGAGKGLGVVPFVLFYMVYIIGYTIINMTAQTLPALMTNDPKQRPTVGVWQTALNYVVPMILTVVLNNVILPRFGNEYTLGFLKTAALVVTVISFVGVILVAIGISAFDKPEMFQGIGKKADERLKVKDMLNVLSHNKPLQSYIVSAASDKIAQQAAATGIVTTMLSGILIGNMQLATILSVIGMLPSIIFAVIGARYAGKHGNKESIVRWTIYCIGAGLLSILFFVLIDPRSIATMGVSMILYILLTLVLNGCMMCVTTANTGFMADIIDFELDRSGKYIPAVVTGTYSLVDKIVSAFSAMIATGCVALIGYTNSLPQPNDPSTPGVFWVTMFLKYGLAILGWICTLLAMRACRLDKAEMVEVQKRIADKKAEAQTELFEEELHKGDPKNA
ncbi:MAG: MFS transporter [Oscillospiraceae bacterium]|nr:MFS transporter [Oscillospiraceae bacterium]